MSRNVIYIIVAVVVVLIVLWLLGVFGASEPVADTGAGGDAAVGTETGEATTGN